MIFSIVSPSWKLPLCHYSRHKTRIGLSHKIFIALQKQWTWNFQGNYSLNGFEPYQMMKNLIGESFFYERMSMSIAWTTKKGLISCVKLFCESMPISKNLRLAKNKTKPANWNKFMLVRQERRAAHLGRIIKKNRYNRSFFIYYYVQKIMVEKICTIIYFFKLEFLIISINMPLITSCGGPDRGTLWPLQIVSFDS